MVKRTFFKECARAVRGTFSRFLAIFAIVALGTGFLAGLLATTPDMRRTAGDYYRDTNLYDLRIVSSLGLEEDDVRAVAGVAGVSAVMPARFADRQLLLQSGDTLVGRLHGVADWTDENALNRPLLVRGRWPQSPDECVVEQEFDLLADLLDVGCTLSLLPPEEGETVFRVADYTVVGVVTSGYYISMVQRGSTSVGNGSIGCIVYVSDACFDLDYYTDLYVAAAGAAEAEAYSEEYDSAVAPVKEAIEALSETQSHVRADRIRSDAQSALQDARAELADKKAEGLKELEDACKTLEDGERDYQQGLKEYEDGKAALSQAREELQKAERELPEALRELEDGRRDYAAGLEEYEAGKREYEDGLAAYQAGLAELEDNRVRLEAAAAEIASGEDTLAEAAQQLESAREEIRTGYRQLRDAEAQLDDGKKQLAEAERQLDAEEAQLELDHASGAIDDAAYALGMLRITVARAVLASQKQELVRGQRELDQGYAKLRDAETQLAAGQAEYDENAEKLADARARWEEGSAQLAEGEALLAETGEQLESAKAELESAKAELDEAARRLGEGQAAYEDGQQRLSRGRADYRSGLRELENARAELESGRKELDDGWADYRKGEEAFSVRISDAEQKLVEAQDRIDSIESPEWYVLTRGESNEGYIFYESDTEKVASIAKVFPVFFFLVAALVASTTMTRMIDEDRGSIGTLKALGYGNGAIAAKYLLYAASACLLGSVFGLSVGLPLFPRVLCNAYRMMYQMPKLHPAPHGRYILLSAGLILAAVLLATLGALRTSLRDCAAQLMRPKAPPAGKRIFLEHIRPLWTRMRFTHKVTARNLFRYKKRFFMTVIGVAGCTALLLTGFGLRDSIRDIVAVQFGELQNYHMTLTLRHDGDDRADRRVRAVLTDPARVTDYLAVHAETGTGSCDGRETDLHIVVPSDDSRLTDFVVFRDRKTGETVPFSREGAVLTEKAAALLGVRPGGTLLLKIQDGSEARIPVAGICENYVYGYLYLPRDLWREAFGTDGGFTTVLAKTVDPDQAARDAIASELLTSSNALGVTFTTTVIDTFTDMLSRIDYIVMVLIISAAALAFVVLYNLTNINICEREKELATIKVLGFFPREVSAYVFREALLLSLIGTAAGLIGGIFLHRFVVQTAEVDAVMFGRTIKPLSYLISAAMTMLFTLLVDLVMERRLRKIDMVESLKAPE